MAIKWTAERNEHLLLLVVREFKIDSKAAKKLAEQWSEQYGNDDFQPTARAITEQFGVLKKKAGGKDGAGKGANGVSTPKTHRTTNGAAKSTPASSRAEKPTTANKPTASTTPSKRKHTTLSDDDDNESLADDSEPDLKNLRGAMARTPLARAKKVPKRYEESSDDEKADDESDGAPAVKGESVSMAMANGDGDEIHVAGPKAKAKVNGSGAGGLDAIMGELMAEGVPVKKAKSKADSVAEDDSDDSDWLKAYA